MQAAFSYKKIINGKCGENNNPVSYSSYTQRVYLQVHKSIFMKQVIKRIAIIFLFVFAGLSLLCAFSIRWAFRMWPDLKMEEIIFELQAPLEGTGGGMIGKYIAAAVLPTVLILAAAAAVCAFAAKKKKAVFLYPAVLIASAAVLTIGLRAAWKELSIGEWIENEAKTSEFIEEHYADPAVTEVTFPEKKRNLIYIYLESVEVTFADKAKGGAFDYNCIPELTALAEENEDFSGDSGELEGGIALPGTTWTMGAMFGMTSGLPLKVSLGNNQMSSQNSFFPDIRTMGDILAEEGYKQTLLIGSDAAFAGRKLYFTGHGGFRIQDYNYARDNGLIPQGYKVWWGFEDERLFSQARETLLELAAGDEPFNLTMLTVDTHFPNGYVCDLCREDFENNQYANVFACSSRQTAEFIDWIRQQDFYENTTIVISGDHPTMDKHFCEDVDKDYVRKTYTCYINADAEADPAMGRRTYSTLDNFPTTLAALGAKIEGERLGLGTNLFSSVPTLCEEYGYQEVRTELKRKSVFLQKLEKVDLSALLHLAGATIRCRNYDPETEELEILLKHIHGLKGSFVSADAVLTDSEGHVLAEASSDTLQGTNRCEITVKAPPEAVIYGRLNVYVTDSETGRHAISENMTCPVLSTGGDFEEYLKALLFLREYGDYSILISVKDDVSVNFTPEMKELMGQLGLSADLSDSFRNSYIAVLTGDSVYEKESGDRITYSGTLPGGKKYTIMSSGYNAESGPASSIVIDGDEFSTNSRGFNVVVYDDEAKATISSLNYDLYRPQQYTCRIETGGRFERFGRVHIRISEVSMSESMLSHVIVNYWYEDTPEKMVSIELKPGEADDFEGLIRGKLFSSSPLHLNAWLVNSRGKWYYVGEETIGS